MEGALKYSPAAAVPVSTKIPEPMIAPIPRAVSDHGPSVFFSRCSGASASASNLSMLLTLKSCEFTPTAGQRVAKLYPEAVQRRNRGYVDSVVGPSCGAGRVAPTPYCAQERLA